jgi:hypothetical protein
MVEIRIGALGDGDRKGGVARQIGKQHLRLHVMPNPIARPIGEAARELHEQIR